MGILHITKYRQEFSNLESVKAASSVNSPVDGTIVEVNSVSLSYYFRN